MKLSSLTIGMSNIASKSPNFSLSPHGAGKSAFLRNTVFFELAVFFNELATESPCRHNHPDPDMPHMEL